MVMEQIKKNEIAVFSQALVGTGAQKVAQIAAVYRDSNEAAMAVRVAGMPFVASLKAIFRAQGMEKVAARKCAELMRDTPDRKTTDISLIDSMRERVSNGLSYLEKVRDGSGTRSYIEKSIKVRGKRSKRSIESEESIAKKAHNDAILSLVAAGLITEDVAREKMR
jgi:hypothetical protein